MHGFKGDIRGRFGDRGYGKKQKVTEISNGESGGSTNMGLNGESDPRGFSMENLRGNFDEGWRGCPSTTVKMHGAGLGFVPR